MSGDLIVVSARWKSETTTAPYTYSGAAYVFVRDASTGAWVSEQKLVPYDGKKFAEFGQSVAIEGSTIAVGAWIDEAGSPLQAGVPGTGTVRMFDRVVDPLAATGHRWLERSVVVAKTGAANDRFGATVDLSEDGNMVVGAPYKDVQGASSGAGYVFRHNDSFCTDVDTIDLTFGGFQRHELNAGFRFGGLLYLVLGSTAPTTTGIVLDGHVLPLDPDTGGIDWFGYTLNAPNTPPWSGSLGNLDADGKAEATFTLTTGGNPLLVNFTLTHAFLVFDPNLLQVVATSNAQTVAFTP